MLQIWTWTLWKLKQKETELSQLSTPTQKKQEWAGSPRAFSRPGLLIHVAWGLRAMLCWSSHTSAELQTPRLQMSNSLLWEKQMALQKSIWILYKGTSLKLLLKECQTFLWNIDVFLNDACSTALSSQTCSVTRVTTFTAVYQEGCHLIERVHWPTSNSPVCGTQRACVSIDTALHSHRPRNKHLNSPTDNKPLLLLTLCLFSRT